MTSNTRRAVAINYHFVRAANPGRFGLRAHERPERFSEQLARLAEHFEFVCCRDLFGSSGNAAGPQVVVTFDDGAVDVYRSALPELVRWGATATAFVCSKPYLEGRLLQIQRVEYLMSRLGLEKFHRAFYDQLELQFPGDLPRESLDFADGYRFYRYDAEPIRRFKLDLNYQLPYANVEPVLEALFEGVFGPGSEAEAVRETYMSLDELKRLMDAGAEIGTHTHSHLVLPRLDFLEQRREIETSVDFLKKVTGEPRISVAYPFGFHDADTKQAASEVGLLAGFAGGRRWIHQEDLQGRWSVPRYDVNDCFDRATNEFADGFLTDLPADGGSRDGS